MDKKIVSLVGAAAALTTLSAAAAAAPSQATELTPTTSYEDLLDPIPNASALLRADDARRADAPQPPIENVQYRDHHHHHHSQYWRRRFYFRRTPPHHHHHHHHHHGYYRG